MAYVAAQGLRWIPVRGLVMDRGMWGGLVGGAVIVAVGGQVLAGAWGQL